MARISRQRLDMEGGRIDQAALRNYAEATIAANTGASYAINLSQGNVFNLTLTNNCTFSFINALPGVAHSCTLVLHQDETGNRTATWPDSVKWPNNTPPVLTPEPERMDILSFMTTDGGTTWFGVPSARGYDFSPPPPPVEISFFDSTTSTNANGNCTAPAGIIAGDIIVRVEMAYIWDDSFVLPSLAPGFTVLRHHETFWTSGTQDNSNYSYNRISFKLAVGNEGGQTFPGIAGDDGQHAILVFRAYANALQGVGGNSSQNAGSTNGPSNINIGSSDGWPNQLVIGTWRKNAAGAPTRGMSPDKDGELQIGLNTRWVAWKIFNGSPSNVTLSTNNNWGNPGSLVGGRIRAS